MTYKLLPQIKKKDRIAINKDIGDKIKTKHKNKMKKIEINMKK